MFKHTQNCQHYKDKLKNHLVTSKPKYSNILMGNSIPNRERDFEIIEFAKSCYKVISSNFRNYYQRITTESIAIKLHKPKINKQIDFNKSKSKKPITLKLF